MDCEVLLQPEMVLRAQKMLGAMIETAEAAGVTVHVTRRWSQKSRNLMTYGLGHPVRRLWTESHKQDGGRLIGWDLGYWNREVPVSFSMRLTIDDDHPHRWLRPEPVDRWESAKIKLREDADPKGPVVLVGLGRKQRVMMELVGQQWEQRQLMLLRRRFPDREVVFRPKRPESLPRCRTVVGPIEQAIRGASLVVCHHSNVAVDACIAGIPVECTDGAALALYRDNPNPTREERLAFLQSLAWWQWTPLEGVEAWRYIMARLT